MKDDNRKGFIECWLSINSNGVHMMSDKEPVFDEGGLWTVDFLKESEYYLVLETTSFVFRGMKRCDIKNCVIRENKSGSLYLQDCIYNSFDKERHSRLAKLDKTKKYIIYERRQ